MWFITVSLFWFVLFVFIFAHDNLAGLFEVSFVTIILGKSCLPASQQHVFS